MTNDTNAPKRIWAWETLNCNGQWTIAEGEGVEYIRHDHALALAAAAVAHPQDAQAALEADRERMRKETLREALDSIAELERGSSEDIDRGHEEAYRAIEALIEGDTDE